VTLPASKHCGHLVTRPTVLRWDRLSMGRDATRLTCAGGGTALASLRVGRRPAMAFLRYLRPPMMHPRPLGEVGWGGAGNTSNVRRVTVVPVRGVQVSGYCNLL